ncbi:HSP90 family protein [Leucobacter sp. G161]|uniref:HSP90 family protein n=1 Tax=Leucobacter sp. G161 TaxID=663704 RepID=UPI00073C67D3|nr:HSP90 family protein [Leucobacter sp. G161]KUF06926.1 molecular chaperone HtpG [Leucobacter sp. G161]
MSERFQVDLTGMVDLLSRHLYSGPQVYLRELIQNAVDAVTARVAQEPDAPALIRLRTDADGAGNATLEVSDTGIGLTADEATELLATIGRSSKRDTALGTGRSEFIGQFGIGMLAAFMVAEQIEFTSRSAKPGSVPVRWRGRAEGTFDVAELPGAGDEIEIGTTVRLTARRDAAHWLANDTVLGLARDYGSLLPFDVAVRVPVAGGTGESGGGGGKWTWRRVTEPELPWRVEYPSGSARAAALTDYCERTFGFTPLGHIDLELPVAGVTGAAFILPQAVTPGSGQHRVYMKRMLLSTRTDRVLPDWSFFVRAVIDSDTLSPTASREQLHDDEILLGVRDALGEQIKRWALDTLRTPSQLARKVLETHHLALRAIALTDQDMLDLVAEVLPFETSDGPMTLAMVADGGELVYTSTTEAFQRVAAVARAQGLVVVNAGYVYDSDILAKLAAKPGWQVRELSSADLVQVLGMPGVEREMAAAGALSVARGLLADEDCDAILRTFAPETVPAVLLRDPDGEHRRDLDRERSASPDLWDGLLDSFAGESQARTRTLVLNDASPVARRLLDSPGSAVFGAGLRSLYLSAVMLAGEGLRSAESAALSDSLGVLLDAALDAPRPAPESPSTDF